MSLAPVIKMGVLLGRSLAGKQMLVTCACGVVPSGLPIRGPDMSFDMRLLAVSDETVGSDVSESIALGLSYPLGLDGATGWAKTVAYVAPHSGGPSCRLQAGACSPVTADALSGRGADPTPGAGRRFAGSNDLPEFARSLALRLLWG